MQGTFGVVRTIEDTGMQANATGELFLVNVIFQESWFNITGINGGNFLTALALGYAQRNMGLPSRPVGLGQPNGPPRLARNRPDASEERNSQNGARFSKTQRHRWPGGLGNLTVGRETGLMPIPLMKDDRLRLAGQEGITLTVSAGDTRIDVRDGHNLTVIEWTGVYEGDGEAGWLRVPWCPPGR